MSQLDLFGGSTASLPEGFRYVPDVVPLAMQDELLAEMPALPFKAFDFHGFEGKRRVCSFGWKYDFDSQRLQQTETIPALLLPVRELAARCFGLAPERLQQALVTEYGPGAPIGWHKDKAVFGDVVGISLLSACTFRLRRKVGSKWERVALVAEPGSAYLISGPARSEWEHSIPPVDHLRYSITFRNLRVS
jgi:alkylated DNA repair dioxygenase AlkB